MAVMEIAKMNNTWSIWVKWQEQTISLFWSHLHYPLYKYPCLGMRHTSFGLGFSGHKCSLCQILDPMRQRWVFLGCIWVKIGSVPSRWTPILSPLQKHPYVHQMDWGGELLQPSFPCMCPDLLVLLESSLEVTSSGKILCTNKMEEAMCITRCIVHAVL